jgi:2',3'-cyclic-nucleotide 2'-phosphodiesterase (5'-nucleotidase family)
MPFENYLVILELSNDEMESLLNYILAKSLDNTGVPLSGIRIKIRSNNVSRCLINNREIDSNKTYNVLTTNYLANGGDNMTFFKKCKKYDTGLLLRDAIMNYIKQLAVNGIQIDAQLDGRVNIN